jgi:hypothetical protein
MEEFEEIKGFSNYLINKEGKVWTKLKNRLLKPSLDKDGYYIVDLTKDGKHHKKKVHRLVGIQFIPNPNNLPCIDHIDRNRQNNSLENLRWVNNITNLQNLIVRGCIYWDKLNKGWKAKINIFGKTYRKYSKDKEVVEEWLKKIKEEYSIC